MSEGYGPQNGGDDPGKSTSDAHAGRGLITRPQAPGTTPALLAEQQRARTEIEAAISIAQARPRDERRCLDEILIACQREGIAKEATYNYSRGGTAIEAVSIRLMEVIAQKWGNIQWGFRELTRIAPESGRPGRSIVEAYAWDLQTTARRSVQIVIEHFDSDRKQPRLAKQRDIYEYVANQAQRRVRTCLENVIPRDIIEDAVRECEKTLRAKVQINDESLSKLLAAFAEFGVTKEAIEKRVQRRLEALTPAQFVHLRKIYTGLRDGVSSPDEWFDIEPTEEPKRATEAAKEELRRRVAETQAGSISAKVAEAKTIKACDAILEEAGQRLSGDELKTVWQQVGKRKAEIRAARQHNAKGKPETPPVEQPSAEPPPPAEAATAEAPPEAGPPEEEETLSESEIVASLEQDISKAQPEPITLAKIRRQIKAYAAEGKLSSEVALELSERALP